MARTPAAFLSGLITWTATEYVVHRWVMHDGKGSNPFSEEHLDHHGNPFRTTQLKPDADNIGWKAAGFVAATALPAPLVGFPRALWHGLGFTMSYCTYTWTHNAIHQLPPSTKLGRALRVHHLRHHFSTPRQNFGVTSWLWDRVAGTKSGTTAGTVTIPKRLAPPWLLDDDGTIGAEYAHDYVVKGGSERRAHQLEVLRATQNLAPELS